MKLLRRCGTVALLCAACSFVAVATAQADLRVCNKTTSRVGIAIGYKADARLDHRGLVDGQIPTAARRSSPARSSAAIYYMYAVDYDQGGEWGGNSAFFCTQEKEFTIEGVSDCVARGYQRTGFYEVDTGNQESWTIQLTEPTSRGVGGR